MTIKVLLFGISTDLVGSNALDLQLESSATVEGFKNEIQRQYPNLSELNSYAIAVNESYATDSTELKEGDTVAIIPPVSGG